MSLSTQCLALLRLGAREWWRTRSAALLGLVVLAVFALAHFLAGLAVTEVAAQRTTLHAGLARPVVALLFALTIVVTIVRDLDDRVLDTLLARPLARRTWYLSRLLTQLGAAVLLAVVTVLPLAGAVAPLALAAWTLSFACELAILAALALACAVSLGRVAWALGAVGGFYALARAIAALLLMVQGPASDPARLGDALVAHGVQGLALVLPDFSRYAPTAWLLGDTQGLFADLGYALVQGGIYVALLAALGLVDFERREL